MPTADKLGIPECDEYIQKMTDCLAKMPLDAKSEALTGHQQSLWSWRAALSEGVPPSALVDACRASLAAVNTDSRCK